MQFAHLVERQGNDLQSFLPGALDPLLGGVPCWSWDRLQVRRSKDDSGKMRGRTCQRSRFFGDRAPSRVMIATLKREIDRSIGPCPLRGEVPLDAFADRNAIVPIGERLREPHQAVLIV